MSFKLLVWLATNVLPQLVSWSADLLTVTAFKVDNGLWCMTSTYTLRAACFCCLMFVQEVLDFQIDKQARLNQLPATVSLRRHQLVLLDTATADADAGIGSVTTAGSDMTAGGVLSGDLSEALVFSSHALERLKHRMQVCAALAIVNDMRAPRDWVVRHASGKQFNTAGCCAVQ